MGLRVKTEKFVVFKVVGALDFSGVAVKSSWETLC